eukprot:364189-Chlamydomonas_euryale.AAC.18
MCRATAEAAGCARKKLQRASPAAAAAAATLCTCCRGVCVRCASRGGWAKEEEIFAGLRDRRLRLSTHLVGGSHNRSAKEASGRGRAGGGPAGRLQVAVVIAADTGILNEGGEAAGSARTEARGWGEVRSGARMACCGSCRGLLERHGIVRRPERQHGFSAAALGAAKDCVGSRDMARQVTGEEMADWPSLAMLHSCAREPVHLCVPRRGSSTNGSIVACTSRSTADLVLRSNGAGTRLLAGLGNITRLQSGRSQLATKPHLDCRLLLALPTVHLQIKAAWQVQRQVQRHDKYNGSHGRSVPSKTCSGQKSASPTGKLRQALTESLHRSMHPPAPPKLASSSLSHPYTTQQPPSRHAHWVFLEPTAQCPLGVHPVVVVVITAATCVALCVARRVMAGAAGMLPGDCAGVFIIRGRHVSAHQQGHVRGRGRPARLAGRRSRVRRVAEEHGVMARMLRSQMEAVRRVVLEAVAHGARHKVDHTRPTHVQLTHGDASGRAAGMGTHGDVQLTHGDAWERAADAWGRMGTCS